jgi:pimeloyl-ACP methyl ester carboxylesterase
MIGRILFGNRVRSQVYFVFGYPFAEPIRIRSPPKHNARLTRLSFSSTIWVESFTPHFPMSQPMKIVVCCIMSICCMTLPLSDPCFAQTSSGEPGKQVEQSFDTSDGGTISYLLYLPKDYDSANKSQLILFLHGRGESYGPLNLVAKWGPPRFAARGDELPYVLVSPQCPGDDSWQKPTQQKRLVELLDHIVNKYSIDEDRICLTGLSMGGYGSWRMAADHPERFSSVVPVCGGGDPGDAEKLQGLPIWVFHGDQDGAVPIQRSVEMVEAIKAAGGTKIRFTSLEHIGHNCWSAAYATPELYQWIRQQKKTVD